MKNKDSQSIRLGMFVLLGIVLFVAGIYLIGQQKNMFRETLTIHADFKNVNGLQKGNNVRYSGINVGVVKTLEMVNDSTVRVAMSIEEKMSSHIRRNSVATIGSDGLVGNAIINILPGDGMEATIKNGDGIKSISKIGADDILSSLSGSINNTEVLTQNLLRITNSINEGKGTLGVLLNDTLMAFDLMSSINNLKVATLNASNTINELNGVVKSIKTDNKSVLGTLLNDSISGNKLKMTVKNLESTSLEMKTVLEQVNELIVEINASEGAFNYLVKDTSVVNSLKSTLKNVNDGTAKFNQDMEALKHNFLTRGYFRKLELKEKKEAKKAEKERD